MTKRALLLIDVQQGFDDPYWGCRNNPNAETNMALLLNAWRLHHFPVIHIQHCSLEEKSPLHPKAAGNAFKNEIQPTNGEKQFQKTVNSAFIGTGLEKYLQDVSIKQLCVVGLTTDHCVSTTTRMAGNLGFDVVLVSDATATFAKTSVDTKTHYTADSIHDIHLASLNGEFCTVLSTEQVLQQLSE